MVHIKSTESLGTWIRHERKRQGLTQKQLSGLIGVSERFIGELERGKATAEVGKVLHVLNNLGAQLSVKARGQG